MPMLEAFVSGKNGMEKSGNRKTGVEETAIFNWSNVSCAEGGHLKFSQVSKVVNGVAMEA